MLKLHIGSQSHRSSGVKANLLLKSSPVALVILCTHSGSGVVNRCAVDCRTMVLISPRFIAVVHIFRVARPATGRLVLLVVRSSTGGYQHQYRQDVLVAGFQVKITGLCIAGQPSGHCGIILFKRVIQPSRRRHSHRRTERVSRQLLKRVVIIQILRILSARFRCFC